LIQDDPPAENAAAMGKRGDNLRNVVHRPVHKERAQPKARSRLGYLEKHKDYVKRAVDHNKKQKKLRTLHANAFFRNPDEFAFKMVNRKQTPGGKVSQENKHLSQEQVSLADAQDAKYISLREQADRKFVEKTEANLHFLDADKPNRQTIFLDDDDLRSATASSSSGGVRIKDKLKSFDVAGYFETHPALLAKKSNRLRLKQLETHKFADKSELDRAERVAYRELFHRQERTKKLIGVREQLEFRTLMHKKGRKMKVKDATDGHPAIYRWAPQRQR